MNLISLAIVEEHGLRLGTGLTPEHINVRCAPDGRDRVEVLHLGQVVGRQARVQDSCQRCFAHSTLALQDCAMLQRMLDDRDSDLP